MVLQCDTTMIVNAYYVPSRDYWCWCMEYTIKEAVKVETQHQHQTWTTYNLTLSRCSTRDSTVCILLYILIETTPTPIASRVICDRVLKLCVDHGKTENVFSYEKSKVSRCCHSVTCDTDKEIKEKIKHRYMTMTTT